MDIPNQLKKEEFRFILINKESKVPIEKDWQTKNNYRYDDPKLLNHISKGNYGVLLGHGGLIVIDADTEEFAKEIEKKLPETFTVETGSGGRHYYYLSDAKKKIIFIKRGIHHGELQTKGQFVVGANCIHPNKKRYKIIKDGEIRGD